MFTGTGRKHCPSCSLSAYPNQAQHPPSLKSEPVDQSRYPKLPIMANPAANVGALLIAGVLMCAHVSICLFFPLLCFRADVFILRL